MKSMLQKLTAKYVYVPTFSVLTHMWSKYPQLLKVFLFLLTREDYAYSKEHGSSDKGFTAPASNAYTALKMNKCDYSAAISKLCKGVKDKRTGQIIIPKVLSKVGNAKGTKARYVINHDVLDQAILQFEEKNCEDENSQRIHDTTCYFLKLKNYRPETPPDFLSATGVKSEPKNKDNTKVMYIHSNPPFSNKNNKLSLNNAKIIDTVMHIHTRYVFTKHHRYVFTKPMYLSSVLMVSLHETWDAPENHSSLRSEMVSSDPTSDENNDSRNENENASSFSLAGPNTKDNISGGGAAGAAGDSAPAKPSAFSAINADTQHTHQQVEQKLTHLQVAKQNGFGRREVDIFKMWVQAGGTEHSPTSKTFLRSLRSIKGLLCGEFYSNLPDFKKYDRRYGVSDFRAAFAEYSTILTQPDVYPENKDVLKGLTLPHFFYCPQAAMHKSWFAYILDYGAKKIEGSKPKCFEQIYPNSDRKYEDTYEKIEEALKIQNEEETFDAATWYDEKFPDADYGDRELDLDILQRRKEFYEIIESSPVWHDEGKMLLISDMVEMQSIFLGLTEHLPEGYKDISDYRDFFTFVRCIVDGWWRKTEKNSLTRRQIFSYGVICSPSIIKELLRHRIIKER